MQGPLSRRLIAAIGLIAFLVVPLLAVMPAQAFKPYTHTYSADRALDDVVADGKVTIDGREYVVNTRVVAALQAYPEFYRGGSIGPDGFPDFTYGQSVIHPTETGKWMRYIFDKAWEAQTDPAYPTEAERLQILAFAYGYLTHAAGDMWAHTLVNDFALGVFPGVGEILTEADEAAIAIRHIIIEGYIGDATYGFDGNPDRTQVGGDVSDDSTPAVTIDAPHTFVFNTLIDPNAPTPVAGRGPIIDGFLTLRASLVAELGAANPDPIQDAINAYQDTEDAFNELANEDCNFGSGISDDLEAAADAIADLVNCPAGLLELGITAAIDSLEALWELASSTLELLADAVKDAYIAAWIDDIDAGLLEWNKLGLAISRAVFDPAAYRATQNDSCFHLGDESMTTRINCENGIGAIDVLFHEADPFINDHLLSMAGLPDLAGDIRGILQDIATQFQFVQQAFGVLLNPINSAIADIKEAVKQLVLDIIEEATGVDIELLKSFLTQPSYWINVTDVTLTLPGLGATTMQLFEPDDHAQLDSYLGLGPDHHTGEFVFNDVESTRLKDDAFFDGASFAAYGNTVTMSKLVLLDAPELNRAMGDSLVAQGMVHNATSVTTYPAFASDAPTNVIFHPLNGVDPWLLSIDSDHGWRSNPLPIFCAVGTVDCDVPGLNPLPRDASLNAGNGQFPIWESCLLRPAFRAFFKDWENGTENFPDLNDAPSADSSDPNAPVTTLTPTGNVYSNGGTTFVGDGHSFTLGATDAVFTNAFVNVQYRYYPDGTTPGEWQSLQNGGMFSIPSNSGDGVWRIDYRAEDPCHTFVDESGIGSDPLPPDTQSTTVVLDTTAPVISIVSPIANTLFDSDDMSMIDYTVEDGALGSGVASHAVTLDGDAAVDGQVLDMFLLETGVHTIHVTSVDNLGNGSELSWTFEMQATSQSLIGNIDRGYAMREIRDRDTYRLLRYRITMAAVAHLMNDHKTEWKRLGLLIDDVKRARGKTISVAYADKIITWAQEVIDAKQ